MRIGTYWVAAMVVVLCTTTIARPQAVTMVDQSVIDLQTALKQQREEAQDKLVNAYMTIMKLQRELDKMKEAEKKDAPPPSPK